MGRADLEVLRAGSLTGARSLDLSRCGLTQVPREVFGLASTLETLDLSGNALVALPDDMGQLATLQRLFCSGNPFEVLPAVLGDCPRLSQIGFRGCGLREVPPEALPPAIRWLTLTDNRLEALPAALGERPALQKLMLAGNRLRALPESMAGADRLELLRISANDLAALPSWLDELPALAWLAFAGNPFEVRAATKPVAAVRWPDLRLGPLLGQGASGFVYAASWSERGDEQLALKVFKGTMTSDGLPDCEAAACLAAPAHPSLVAAIGSLTDHPEGSKGLLLPRIPPGWRILAGPPSAQSCSRDVYPVDFGLESNVALQIASCIGGALAHLHRAELMHGDVYAHNTFWDGATGSAQLSDFGAASFLNGVPAERLNRLEVRAWGLLLGELLDRCGDEAPAGARSLQHACISGQPSSRPSMADALDALRAACA